jgi:inosine-uridine nucleoside N-ribohydrolase
LLATAGNVSGEQATRNVHILVEQLDPPRWPRIGAALLDSYDIDGRRLHGPNGLGGVDFPCAQLHHPHAGDKLLADLVRQNPKEITVVVLGPATVLARAFDRDPELAGALERILLVGGTWHEPGDAGPVSEFHFACDPPAARQVLRAGVPLTLVPLDVSRKLVLSPTDLLKLADANTPAVRFLQRIVPPGFSSTASLFGTEGFYLQDVVGVATLTMPSLVTSRPVAVDVEVRGELTRGMSVVDVRWACTERPNADLVTEVDLHGIRQYILALLSGQAT